MAKYPIRIDISKPRVAAPKPAPQNKPAPPITQRDLDKHARMQGIEASESLLLKRGRPDVIRTTVTERTTPTKKGK